MSSNPDQLFYSTVPWCNRTFVASKLDEGSAPPPAPPRRSHDSSSGAPSMDGTILSPFELRFRCRYVNPNDTSSMILSAKAMLCQDIPTPPSSEEAHQSSSEAPHGNGNVVVDDDKMSLTTTSPPEDEFEAFTRIITSPLISSGRRWRHSLDSNVTSLSSSSDNTLSPIKWDPTGTTTAADDDDSTTDVELVDWLHEDWVNNYTFLYSECNESPPKVIVGVRPCGNVNAAMPYVARHDPGSPTYRDFYSPTPNSTPAMTTCSKDTVMSCDNNDGSSTDKSYQPSRPPLAPKSTNQKSSSSSSSSKLSTGGNATKKEASGTKKQTSHDVDDLKLQNGKTDSKMVLQHQPTKSSFAGDIARPKQLFRTMYPPQALSRPGELYHAGSATTHTSHSGYYMANANRMPTYPLPYRIPAAAYYTEPNPRRAMPLDQARCPTWGSYRHNMMPPTNQKRPSFPPSYDTNSSSSTCSPSKRSKCNSSYLLYGQGGNPNASYQIIPRSSAAVKGPSIMRKSSEDTVQQATQTSKTVSFVETNNLGPSTDMPANGNACNIFSPTGPTIVARPLRKDTPRPKGVQQKHNRYDIAMFNAKAAAGYAASSAPSNKDKVAQDGIQTYPGWRSPRVRGKKKPAA